MAYEELVPHPALRAFVDRFWVRTSEVGSQAAHILPDGCIDLLLDVETAKVTAVGPMSRPLILAACSTAACRALVAVRFRPGGAVPLLRLPAHELADRRVALDDLGLRGPLLPTMGQRAHPGGATARARHGLEHWLLERLPSPAATPALDCTLAFAARALATSPAPSVERLAARLGCSRQHLGRLFRTRVGIGPKQLARVARVHRAVALLAGPRRPAGGLAGAAVALGYFDEAHMDREFRELVGMSPGKVRARGPGSIRPILSLFGEAESPA